MDQLTQSIKTIKSVCFLQNSAHNIFLCILSFSGRNRGGGGSHTERQNAVNLVNQFANFRQIYAKMNYAFLYVFLCLYFQCKKYICATSYTFCMSVAMGG